MNRMPRSSRRCVFFACGSMTTNRLRSNSKWRSISGRVPLPIDPNPIITIGPVIRPWTGHVVIGIS
jgi:hypothetical protein